MTVSKTDLFDVPPLSALRRPLTEAEARKWRGSAATVSPDVVAWLVENDRELAEKVARILIYRRIGEAMSARLLGPRGPVARLAARMRKAEKSFSRVLR